MVERPGGTSPILLFGPVLISDPSLGCPIAVAAARVRPARDDAAPRYATGWGTDFRSAARTCLFEAEETYFAQVAHRPTHARFDSLAGAVAPPDLVHVSERQFATRKAWNETHAERDAVPPRWQRERAIGWLAADAGPGATPAFVPAGLCGLGAHPDQAAGLPVGDSNGLATGETLSDAVVRGFLELVERDACAIWWYNRLVLPRLAVRALGDRLVEAYAAWLASRRRRLVLLDLTHDLDVPVTAAVAHDLDGGRIAFGFGAGRSAADAARHAVGELAQCEANLALMVRQAASQGLERFSAPARHLFTWWLEARLDENSFLAGGEVHDPPAHVVRLDPGRCRDLCRRHGLAVLWVDLTTPGGPPLARVFVPGLRSIRPRFGPGRLYDVPRRRGFASAAEPDLNPALFPI